MSSAAAEVIAAALPRSLNESAAAQAHRQAVADHIVAALDRAGYQIVSGPYLERPAGR